MNNKLIAMIAITALTTLGATVTFADSRKGEMCKELHTSWGNVMGAIKTSNIAKNNNKIIDNSATGYDDVRRQLTLVKNACAKAYRYRCRDGHDAGMGDRIIVCNAPQYTKVVSGVIFPEVLSHSKSFLRNRGDADYNEASLNIIRETAEVEYN